MADLSTLRDIEFPLELLPPAERQALEALTDDEVAQLAALCTTVRDAGDVEGFGVRYRPGQRLPGASIELPDLVAVPGSSEIVSDNARVMGALYYAWTLDHWPP